MDSTDFAPLIQDVAVKRAASVAAHTEAMEVRRRATRAQEDLEAAEARLGAAVRAEIDALDPPEPDPSALPRSDDEAN